MCSTFRALFIWTLLLSAPIAPLFGQSSNSNQKSSKKSVKRFEVKPEALGIGAKNLGIIRETGRTNLTTFQLITIVKMVRGNDPSVPPTSFVHDGLEVPVFALVGSNALDGDRPRKDVGLLRLTKRGAEVSIDHGANWLLGEKNDDQLVYAFDNLTLTLTPMDLVFTPTTFKAIAFERGVITKVTPDRIHPFFRSVVIALAFGKNEVEGILKYPGTNFVVPLRGIKYKDKWVVRSRTEQPFNVEVWHAPPNAVRGALGLQGMLYTQMELNNQRLMSSICV